MTGRITHLLVAARSHTGNDEARAYIDRAIYMVRKLHRSIHLGS